MSACLNIFLLNYAETVEPILLKLGLLGNLEAYNLVIID